MPDAMMSYQAPGADERIFAEFYTKSVIEPAKSKAAGHPVYHDVTFVKIVQPGDGRLSEYNQPARREDIDRFPRQYAAFERGQKQEVEGAPLSLLFPSQPSIVDNLRRCGIFVVEQLAQISDTAVQEIGLGGRTFKQKAVDYLKKADVGKDFHSLSSRLDTLELQLMEKDEKIKALSAALADKETELAEAKGRKKEKV